MNARLNFQAYYINFLINSFLIILLFNFALPELLNNIIRLGENNLRYCHFSFFSNGDMIIDISAFPTTKERKFFGLKRNGKFYFKENNKETPFYLINDDIKEKYFILIKKNYKNLGAYRIFYLYSLFSEGTEYYKIKYFFRKWKKFVIN